MTLTEKWRNVFFVVLGVATLLLKESIQRLLDMLLKVNGPCENRAVG